VAVGISTLGEGNKQEDKGMANPYKSEVGEPTAGWTGAPYFLIAL
jgi:hypothetical protein